MRISMFPTLTPPFIRQNRIQSDNPFPNRANPQTQQFNTNRIDRDTVHFGASFQQDFAPGSHASGAGGQPPRKPTGHNNPFGLPPDNYSSSEEESELAPRTLQKRARKAKEQGEQEKATRLYELANQKRPSRSVKGGTRAKKDAPESELAPTTLPSPSQAGKEINQWLSTLPVGGYGSAYQEQPTSEDGGTHSTGSQLARVFNPFSLSDPTTSQPVTQGNPLNVDELLPDLNRPLTPPGNNSRTIPDMYWDGQDYRPTTPPNTWNRFMTRFRHPNGNYSDPTDQTDPANSPGFQGWNNQGRPIFAHFNPDGSFRGYAHHSQHQGG